LQVLTPHRAGPTNRLRPTTHDIHCRYSCVRIVRNESTDLSHPRNEFSIALKCT
jgi:hypothetical protein